MFNAYCPKEKSAVTSIDSGVLTYSVTICAATVR